MTSHPTCIYTDAMHQRRLDSDLDSDLDSNNLFNINMYIYIVQQKDH